MMFFKAGDKVKVIESGQLGEVIEQHTNLDRQEFYLVAMNKGDAVVEDLYTPAQIELVKDEDSGTGGGEDNGAGGDTCLASGTAPEIDVEQQFLQKVGEGNLFVVLDKRAIMESAESYSEVKAKAIALAMKHPGEQYLTLQALNVVSVPNADERKAG